MKQVKNYQIYALIAGKYAFVGKTNSKELKPIYWRHLRGENRYTRNCFTKGTPMKPRMYVLTQVRADSSLAYRYEVAFIRILLNEGYYVLNSRGMIEDARDIHMITEKILEDLKRVPLQQRLEMGDIHQRAIMENTDKPNQVMKKEKIAERELANVKITIRGTATEKQRFVDYANDLQVTQRQALQLLLVKQNYDDWWGTDWSADDYVRDLLKGYREENSKLEAEILQLKEEIQILKKKERKEIKEKEKRMRQGIATFFQFFEPAKYGNPALEQGIYRLFNESLDEGNRYQYPTEEGFFLFYPEQVLLGEGKFAPLFIVGEDATGRKTLLRYYPKKYFVGFSFTNEKFGLRGSVWFVGVERAKDEAMDLFFALPVDIMSQIKQEKNTKGSTIDDLLRDAEYRSQFDDYWTKR